MASVSRGLLTATVSNPDFFVPSGLKENICQARHRELYQFSDRSFDEPVDKGNLKSVLERQGNQNIWGNTFGNSNIIGYINVCSDKPNATPEKSQPATPNSQQRRKNKTKIETIDKLRQFGLSDEQIAEALELPLEVVKQGDVEE